MAGSESTHVVGLHGLDGDGKHHRSINLRSACKSQALIHSVSRTWGLLDVSI
jgi:hypothetical protein